MIENLNRLDAVPEDLFELTGANGCVRFEYKHERTYLATADTVMLQVALSNADGKLECLIAERFPDAADNFDLLASSLNQRPINLNAPLALNPVYIPKPWGQEIWFSGIEERGVSSCQGVPIAWLLDLFGRHLGCNSAPLLLKILDPLPEENVGDLYFELHKKKVEVYVVTHVDNDAWPNGVGRIRYGFDQSMLAQYESQSDFLADYRQAVSDYEEIRRAIDSGEPGLDNTAACYVSFYRIEGHSRRRRHHGKALRTAFPPARCPCCRVSNTALRALHYFLRPESCHPGALGYRGSLGTRKTRS